MRKAKAVRLQDARSEGEKIIASIEHDNEWQCMWQVKTLGDRKLVEMFWWPAVKSTVMVTKDFDGAIRSGRPWPQMIGCEVYMPICPDSNTWDAIKTKVAQINQERGA
jgi:hypothetical protein